MPALSACSRLAPENVQVPNGSFKAVRLHNLLVVGAEPHGTCNDAPLSPVVCITIAATGESWTGCFAEVLHLVGSCRCDSIHCIAAGPAAASTDAQPAKVGPASKPVTSATASAYSAAALDTAFASAFSGTPGGKLAA